MSRRKLGNVLGIMDSLRTSFLSRTGGIGFALVLALSATAQKKPLDHSVYDGWNSIRGTVFTRDGQWVAYMIAPQEGDATTTLRKVADGSTISIPRASGLRFSNDGKFALATIIPPFLEARKARRDKVKPEDQPKSALLIVNLTSGEKTQIDRVASWTLAEEDSGFLLYKPEPPKATPAKPDPKKEEAKKEEPKPEEGKKAPAKKDEPKKKADHKPGDTYVLRNLSTAQEEKLELVSDVAFNKFGTVLAYTISTADGKGDGLSVRDLKSGVTRSVATGMGHYNALAFPENGSHLAFRTDKDDYAAKKAVYTLNLYDLATAKTVSVGADSLPKGWVISPTGAVRFSKSGGRLLYATTVKPDDTEDKTPDDEKVSVDVWNYLDAKLQPEQLLAAATEKTRSYDAYYDLAKQKSVQLETPEFLSIVIGDRGDGAFGLAEVDSPYRRQASWDPGASDLYIVDIATGAKRKILTKRKVQATLSPTGNHIAVFDGETKDWTVIDSASGQAKASSKSIPFPVFDELDDHPDVPPSYGLGGWTTDEKQVLINDEFDVWALSTSGGSAKNLTRGRNRGLTLRVVNLDPEVRFLNPDALLLSSFRDDTKAAGYYTRKGDAVAKILEADKIFGVAAKAKDADALAITRQDFVEFPDLWLTNTAFAEPKKITDANPQQKNYNWGKAELVTWTSNDGVKLQGILVKPEDFDYGKKYPLITYFYERNSETLHAYRPPAPSASTINVSLFASNGYCVFIPDIPYKIGYPGESAISAIVPGVQSIVNRGYIDPKRLGIQGQSWGGYQVAYMVTETNMFAAAEAGAPVSNMFSAYGGIRYGSGLVRQFQYEHSQSRIGGTPWDSTMKYFENSPLFFVDKVQTPLMIMSNDKDGAVPHTQGIELFTALRRLNKPSWLVVYNDEDHNLIQRKNRKDLSIRLSQFFDHFLKGAPMPDWMSKGIPAVEKGKNMGLNVPKG